MERGRDGEEGRKREVGDARVGRTLSGGASEAFRVLDLDISGG